MIRRQYYNHLAHKKEAMEQEEELPDRKDASRPFLLRKKGEAGIYIDVIDAVPVNPKEFGLEHAFMMDVKDKLQEKLFEINLVHTKGAFERRGVCNGVVLEEFRNGMILVVTFDKLDALEGLWKLYEKDKLSPMFQDLLVTKENLSHCKVTRMDIRAKMWEDEYMACTDEIRSRSSIRASLDSFKNDSKMLKEIRDYQKTLGDHTLRLRDLELEFERNLENFMVAGRRIIPENETTVKSLREFHKLNNQAKVDKKTGLEVVEKFFESLDKIKKVYRDVEENVCHRLAQVHGICETKEQRELKATIIHKREEVSEFIKPDHNLQLVRFSDWEIKVEPRDKSMFMGLVSLIPYALENLIDIDHAIDDYITKFPDHMS